MREASELQVKFAVIHLTSYKYLSTEASFLIFPDTSEAIETYFVSRIAFFLKHSEKNRVPTQLFYMCVCGILGTYKIFFLFAREGIHARACVWMQE